MVFKFPRLGDSLSLSDVGEQPEYTFNIPAPGKTLAPPEQQLAGGTPGTSVEHTVALADNNDQ